MSIPTSAPPTWRYRYDVRGYWLNYTWTLYLFLGEDQMWFSYGSATSRRRAQRQADFWIRLGIRKFAITDHVPIESGQWRVTRRGRRR